MSDVGSVCATRPGPQFKRVPGRQPNHPAMEFPRAAVRWKSARSGITGWIFSLLAVCLLLQAASNNARATILVRESFDYPDGPLVSAAGGAWLTHSGTTGQVRVVTGRALLSQTNTEDVSVTVSGQPYPASSNTILYAGFSVRFISLPTGNGEYFAHFKTTGTSGFTCRLFATTNGAAPGCLRFGISRSSSTASTVAPFDLALDTSCQIALRYAVSNAATTLWINPTSESDPSTSAIDAGTPVTVSTFALRESYASLNGMGTLQLDDLSIATTFPEVLPEGTAVRPPFFFSQPPSQVVLQGGSVQFQASAGGDPPLFYQWQFQGIDIPSQTNLSLILTNITPNQAGLYTISVSNRAGIATSSPAELVVNTPSSPEFPNLSILSFNANGNGATDWSTNSPQIQAIGRLLNHLHPDILALNEIPNDQWWQMTNFVSAFLQGYYLAVSSGTDGYIRSGVISRWPISLSHSWLDNSDLTPFGYPGRFTRDLFQAQIAITNFPQPLNVFVAHLKATTTSPPDDALKRGAEAAAISNFLSTVYLKTNSLQPYILCGDLNEDVSRPDTNRYTTAHPIQTLISPPTGLQLTTPINPLTSAELTLSIRSRLNVRFDYLLPCPILWSNIIDGQVFRSDILTNRPSFLLGTDSATASDHLPVLMVFSHPFAHPFKLLPLNHTPTLTRLEWESLPGQFYRVESSPDLSQWNILQGRLLSLGYRSVLETNPPPGDTFFRVSTTPVGTP